MSNRIRHWVFYKNFKSCLNTNFKLYNITRVWNFFPKLLISYFTIIVICICSMGVLSYSFVGTSIKEQSINSNDKLLNQFKNTVDSLILSNINNLSMKILKDTTANPYISYYFSNSLDKNIYDMTKVMAYCDTLKSLNPMIFSAGIYFEKNQLLISNEGVKATLYGKMSNQKDFLYYYNLVHESSGIISWHTNSSYDPSMHSKICMVRKIPDKGDSTCLGGAIIISIDENVFYNIIKKTAAQDLDKIIICDSEGTIVSHTDKELLGQNITDFNYGDRIIKTSDRSSNFTAKINGLPYTVSFCSSEYNNWKYITVTPMEKLNVATMFLVKIIIFAAVATILFGILISLIPALKLSNPLKRLVDFCKGVNKIPASKAGNEYNLIQSTIEKLTLSMQEQEQKYIDVLPVLKDNLLQDLISSQYDNDIQELFDRMQLLEFNFPYARFCVLSIHVEKLNTADSPLIHEYSKINIAAILEKIFNTDTSVCLHCEKDGNIAAIINFNMDMDMDIKRIHELANLFIGQKENEFSARLYIGIGTIVEDICNISQSYGIAEAGLKYRYLSPENHIFLSHDIISLEESNLLFDKLLLSNLNTSLRAQDRNKVLNDIDIIISTLKSGHYSYNCVIETLSLCISAVKEVSTGLGISMDATLGNTCDINIQFRKIENIIDFREWIFCLVNHLFNCIDNLHSEINSEMVQKATDYILKNIKSNQLSLQNVANALYISPSHLSRIFRNVTGVTFLDYVTALKLDYCKNLLLNTSLRIDEISSVMGYSTSQYFISRFKIKYGYTPKEYRCKYAGTLG